MVDAEVVRARQRLVGDAVASVKFQPGTSKREFVENQGVKCKRQ